MKFIGRYYLPGSEGNVRLYAMAGDFVEGKVIGGFEFSPEQPDTNRYAVYVWNSLDHALRELPEIYPGIRGIGGEL